MTGDLTELTAPSTLLIQMTGHIFIGGDRTQCIMSQWTINNVVINIPDTPPTDTPNRQPCCSLDRTYGFSWNQEKVSKVKKKKLNHQNSEAGFFFDGPCFFFMFYALSLLVDCLSSVRQSHFQSTATRHYQGEFPVRREKGSVGNPGARFCMVSNFP